MIRSHFIASATSFGPMDDPGVSRPGAEGTQEGTWTQTWMGWLAASSAISLTPFNPNTLAISWGSMNMPVVPRGATARTNSVTVIIPDSTCMWASNKPGTRYIPSASTTRVFSPMVWEASCPTKAIRSPRTAISVSGMISPDWTQTQRPFLITRSALFRPMATSTSALVLALIS